MPNFYKLDKLTYSRGDISELGTKLGKRLDELEHMVDFERRRCNTIIQEKAQES